MKETREEVSIVPMYPHSQLQIIINFNDLQAASKMKDFLRAKYPGDNEGISVGFQTPSGERLCTTFSVDASVKVCKSIPFLLHF